MRLLVTGLAICMLLTGSLNTIATKIQDNVVVGKDEQGRLLTFKHPAVQTAFMFAGEALCLIPFLIRRWWHVYSGKHDHLSEEERALKAKRYRKSFWMFMVPACCDAGATTLLNLGLYYTYASVFQMLRGTLVIFAGLLTIVILKRSLYIHHWLGMVLITAGAALVGASSVIYSSTAGGSSAGGEGGGGSGNVRHLLMLEGRGANGGGGGGPSAAPDPLLGDILVVLAQLLAALQFILEEKFINKYHAPVLLAVGMEGFWGVVLSCAALPMLSYVKGPDGLPLDSLPQAVQQISTSWTLQWTTAATVVSICFFNFFGVSVTKKLSGASRATIDACRTIFIWLFSLHVGWEQFHMLQVVGFIVLVSGTSVYNEILRAFLPAAPRRRRHRHSTRHAQRSEAVRDPEEGALQEPLLEEGSGPSEKCEGREGVVRFAPGTDGQPALGTTRPPLPTRPRPIHERERYTMARSMTILPAALSPHSLASCTPAAYYTDSMADSASVMPGSFAPSSYVSSVGGMEEGGEGVEGVEGSEYSESDAGQLSVHGAGRARELLGGDAGAGTGAGGRPAGEEGA